jgi:hypothetical protein
LFLFSKFNAQSQSVVASWQQFPLVLAYALTIHKAQGLEQPAVEADVQGIRRPAKLFSLFEHTTFDGVLIVMNNKTIFWSYNLQ